MESKRNWINVLTALLILGLAACNTSKQQEDLATVCCQECQEAFSQSPVGVGASGAQCGEFATAQPISKRCQEYFKTHPRTVAECE